MIKYKEYELELKIKESLKMPERREFHLNVNKN